MEIYHHIDMMLPYVDKKDWASLEAEYKQCAIGLAGSNMADAISSVDISAYETTLRKKWHQHIKRLSKHQPKQSILNMI